VTDVLELINEVREAGVILRADPPDLIIRPAGIVRPELKAQLRQRKAEVLQRLELEASMRRLPGRQSRDATHGQVAMGFDSRMAEALNVRAVKRRKPHWDFDPHRPPLA
jgi:hypothetical protein